jgi:hypothetical protein
MLVYRGKLLKQIFSEKWEPFCAIQPPGKIRPSIHKNVDKMLRCGTEAMGYHMFKCPRCGVERKIYHTCKSRFCSKCGVKQTDLWIKQYSALFADCEYKHIVFALPEEFRNYLRVGRTPYFNAFYTAVNLTLNDWYTHPDHREYLPGGMEVLHTFGRDCKYHTHIHMLITCGGLDKTQTKWIPVSFIPHAYLKNRFKLHFLENIRRLWGKETLEKWPKGLQPMFTPAYQQRVLNAVKNETWYVHIGKSLKGNEFVVRYIGRYTKRPAIAESKILAYNGETVTFTFKEHGVTEMTTLTLPVFEFIERVIKHIPDTNFRVIRYFGFYANRVRGKLLPLVFSLLKQNYEAAKKKLANLLSWYRERIEKFTGLDPLICTVCLVPLQLNSIVYTTYTKDYG